MLYRFVKLIVALGVRLYYKEIRVVNREELDQSGPIILIANHPNTLMDAWMLGYVNRRRIHFMAKATFFNSPLKRKLLSTLGIIPINRKSDGVVRGVANKDSFEACYNLLESGQILAIFPEGTSFLERKLRELKTGSARIALEAEARNEGHLGLKVIPIGLNYINADSFRGSVVVHVGKSISVQEYLQEYEVHQGIAAKKLTERFRIELSRVFVTLETEQHEKLGKQLCYLFESKYNEEKGVLNSIGLLKQFQERLDVLSVTEPWKIAEIQQLSDELNRSLLLLGIRPDLLDRTYRRTLFLRQFTQSMLFLFSTIPVFIVGLIHNFVPYWGIGKLVPSLSKEAEYHAPLTVLLGFVLYPLNYLGFYLLFGLFFQLTLEMGIVYFLIMPLSGLFAHFFMRYLKHITEKQHYSRFVKRRHILLEDLKTQRNDLKKLIYD